MTKTGKILRKEGFTVMDQGDDQEAYYKTIGGESYGYAFPKSHVRQYGAETVAQLVRNGFRKIEAIANTANQPSCW